MIAALRDFLSRATPRPWLGKPTFGGQTHIAGSDGASVCVAEGDAFPEISDAALIATAVNNLPSLLDIAEAVRAYRDAVDEREAVASADGVAGGEEPGQMARLAIAETNAYRAMLAALDALETDK